MMAISQFGESIIVRFGSSGLPVSFSDLKSGESGEIWQECVVISGERILLILSWKYSFGWYQPLQSPGESLPFVRLWGVRGAVFGPFRLSK